MSIILTNGTTLNHRPEAREAFHVEEFVLDRYVGLIRVDVWKDDDERRMVVTPTEARDIARALLAAAERADAAIGDLIDRQRRAGGDA